MSAKHFLVFGGQTGWIGGMIVQLLKQQGHQATCAKSRLEDRTAIQHELEEVKPDFIMNCAGVTGTPNVDWCEDHQQETLRSNVIGALTLSDVALQNGIHVTHFGTGCIYEYDKDHPLGSDRGFKEEDQPNFTGSFYSLSKGMVDTLLKSYPNVLNLRIRMPLSDDLHPRSLVTKLIKYQKVVNIPNSMSSLPDLLPISIDMTLKKLKGTFNFTNPGVISHNEVLSLYKQYINPSFTWTNFTLEEQSKVLKAARSNNMLDVSKLLSYYPNLPPIKVATEQLFQSMAKKIQNQNQTTK